MAVQAGLCRTWSETPKTGFLTTRLICPSIYVCTEIEPEIALFADDCVCYREVKDKEDTLKLQKDDDRLVTFARKRGIIIQPVQCNMLQQTKTNGGFCSYCTTIMLLLKFYFPYALAGESS